MATTCRDTATYIKMAGNALDRAAARLAEAQNAAKWLPDCPGGRAEIHQLLADAQHRIDVTREGPVGQALDGLDHLGGHLTETGR
jgi:hypothetical protein